MSDDSEQRTSAELRLLTVEEAARALHIGRTKTYELIADGRLYAIHLGRACRISTGEVARFIRSVDRPQHDDPQPRARRPRQPQRRASLTGPTLFDPEPPAIA